MKGLITKNQNGYFTIEDESGVSQLCRSRGRLKRSTEILVGDWVDYEVHGSQPSITHVYPRKNRLFRPPAANIDRIVLTVSVQTPAVNTYTLDKMIALAENADISPMVCVNKADMDMEGALRLATMYQKAGYTAIAVSAYTGEGLSALRACLTGQVVAFSGPSGVGKSSLLNQFLGSGRFEAGAVSSRTGRGKNTTRHAMLVRFTEQTFLMDTPGYTSLSVAAIHPGDAGYLFRDFRPYIGACRFRDCRHLKEPDCAVRAAAAAGDILPSRYQSYTQIMKELTEQLPLY